MRSPVLEIRARGITYGLCDDVVPAVWTEAAYAFAGGMIGACSWENGPSRVRAGKKPCELLYEPPVINKGAIGDGKAAALGRRA
jgi:hypothetical protein